MKSVVTKTLFPVALKFVLLPAVTVPAPSQVWRMLARKQRAGLVAASVPKESRENPFAPLALLLRVARPSAAE